MTSHNATTLDALWSAFVAAAAELTEPIKSATATVETRDGRGYTYAYLPLPALSALVRGVFARHGLAFRQSVTTSGDRAVTVTTTVVHTCGACWTTEPLTVRAASLSPQDVGSASTYGRRYSLAALVGLSGADDDDAASQHRHPATGASGDGPLPRPPEYPPNERPTAQALRELAELLAEQGHGTPEAMRAAVSAVTGRTVGHAAELSAVEVDRVVATLRAGRQ